MNKARRNPVNIAAARHPDRLYDHRALPGLRDPDQQLQDRKAIFREPLALPDADSFSLIGYQTVLKQGDFFLYFQNSLIVTVARSFSCCCSAPWRPLRWPSTASRATR